MSNIEEKLKQAAESSVLKIIANGDWIAPDYSNRFKLPPEFIGDIWKLVDQEKVKQHMVARLEAELADRIVNRMAEEVSSDIKQILSVKERREAIRALMRDNLDSILKAGA